MPVSQFPTPLDPANPSEPDGPIYLLLQDYAPEYPSVIVHIFKDGGASYGLPNPFALFRWELFYDGHTAAAIETLDNHWVEAQGLFGGFNFRHPRTGTLYSDVHYESYERSSHTKFDIQSRRIVLIKRPTG
jgi:hypothetical protein